MQSDILKALIQEVSALKEIIETSTRRKAVCEGLIKVMTHLPCTDGASTSQPAQTAQPAPEDEENKVEDEDEEEDVANCGEKEDEDDDDEGSGGTPTF